MDTGERDVVDRCDRNRVRDFDGGESEKFPCARGGGDRKLRGVVEALRHHRDGGRKPALNFVGHRERQHELLAGCPGLLGSGENGTKVVTRVTESAKRHVTIEQIYVAHKTGVEERRLIRGRLAATDQRAPARSSVFLELLAQRLEGLSWQRRDGAAKAVQNIAFEKVADIARQLLRLNRGGKSSDSLNC